MNDELRRKIEDAETEGWSLHAERQNSAVMIKRKKGSIGAHLIIALLTAWWTLGVGNLLYLAYKYFSDADKKVLRAEPDDDE